VAKAATADAFSALGDPNRRQILQILAKGGKSVGAIAGELPISRPAVSRHLALLKNAGLVIEEAHGTRRIYRLHELGVESVREYLETVWGDAARRFQIAAENTGRRGGA
jgi:DNA-binding transcriptional ArsR family regulator